MNTPVYSNLEEKSHHFNHKIINSKEELDELLETWSMKDDSKRYIFRGVNNAKFKLYNSGQRAWTGQELEKLGKSYQEFIQQEIDYAKAFQSNLLVKFFNAFGHNAYDFSILSFLQHYGSPTPLLDFSYNFECGLFFCMDGMSHYASEDIDNYFSIYAIDTNQSDLISILNHLESNTKNIEELLSKHGNIDVDDSEVLNNLENLNYSRLEELRLFYLPGYQDRGTRFTIPSRPGFQLVYNQHNLNIINQEGLFVFNSDSEHPLEDYFNDGKFTSFNRTFSLKKIHCWDIHKSFGEYILNRLSYKGITRDFIYPQEEFIALSAFKNFKGL
ncbi:FRG domain-containing protein [Pedobacter sp. GR22-6]|uniref:FRG domain-containing protein n=1 Tax=Pedobacter sp. GR22-6 TaxID=3127957 RepID=UPI00307EC2B3